MITEIPCFARFVRDRVNIVTPDASRSGLGINLWQRQNDDTIQPTAFAIDYLNDVEKKINRRSGTGSRSKGIREISFLFIRRSSTSMYRPSSFGTKNERNRVDLQYSARLTRWLDRLTHFDIPIEHTAGQILPLTDYSRRHPTNEATTEETQLEEYVINSKSDLFFKKKREFRELLNTYQKFLSTDQSTNMILTTDRKPTNEIISPKKLFPDGNSKDFRRKQAKITHSVYTNFNPINKAKELWF